MIRRDNVHRLLLEGRIEGTRNRGRPRIEWTDNIRVWAKIVHYNEMVLTAQDRQQWRRMTANLQKED